MGRLLRSAIVLVLSFGCANTAGTLTDPAGSSPPTPSPTGQPVVPTASPEAAESLTFSGRNDAMFVEVTVTPAHPSIAEEVTFDFLMRYEGTGAARDAGFAVNRYIEGTTGFHDRPDCGGEDADGPADVRRTESTERVTETFRYPGPYEVFFSVSGACIGDEKAADVEAEVVVTGEPKLPSGEVLLPHLQSEASTAVGTPDISITADPEGPCVWAVADGGQRWATLWPIGYRARFDPLRIYDESDREVWREGVPRPTPGQPAGRIARVPEPCREGNNVFTMHRLT